MPRHVRRGDTADRSSAARRGRTVRSGGTPKVPAAAGEQLTDSDLLEFPEPVVVTGRRRRRKGLIAVVISLGALVAVVLTLIFSPLLEVRNVEIHGNDLLQEGRATELLAELSATPLPQVNTATVASLLREESVVEDVTIAAELPHTLHVEVTEHPPVAAVEQADGVGLYSSTGDEIAFFTSADEAATYQVPEIEAEALDAGEPVFSAVAGVLGVLSSEVREELDAATASSIDSVELILQDGRSVVWGSQEQSAAKSAVFDVVLNSDDEAFTEAEIIDISTPSAPVTR